MKIKTIKYNIAQLVFIITQVKTWILEWGRGTGKSTIIGKHLYDCVVEMPRSTGAIVGATYAQIKTRTLPSTIAGLEQHGVYKDLYYTIGKFPPKEWNWPDAYQAVLDPKNAIFWWNGAVTVFISLDGGASSGRGLNIDWAVGDEAALFNKETFDTDVKLTIRGNLHRKAIYPDGSWKYYKDCPRHHSLLLATSTPITTDGEWIFDYEILAEEQEKQRALLAHKLETKYISKEEYNDSIAKIEMKSVKYIKASAKVNIENLGADFFENCKATMPDFIYEAEVLGKRISQIKNGFYPKFNEQYHTYEQYDNEYYRVLDPEHKPTCLGDDDLNKDAPLHLAIDWGSNINCMVVAQKYPDMLKVVKNLYVLSPKIIDDLIKEEFLPYYEPHKNRNKRIYLWYDPSGNVKQANSRLTYAQQARNILVENGWDVQLMTRGQSNESHEKKYLLCNNLFQEADAKYPKIRFNKYNCKELIVSIKLAPAKKGTNVAIQKDKKSEKSKKIPQQHATHFSDAFDVLIVGLYMRLQSDRNDSIETFTI